MRITTKFDLKAPLTIFLVFFCSLIFLVASYQSYQIKNGQESYFPLFTKVQKKLMYDFPEALEYLQELTDDYQITKESDLDKLPENGKILIRKIGANPIWTGFYSIAVDWKDRGELLKAKLFTDIRKGEVWRALTPMILHTEILHLLFNMLWLWMLGKMIEENIKFTMYLFFVLFTATITNTIQYLLTGPFFMGFSGVASAMAGYIWVRKKVAPWELYPINISSLIFLGIFIFGMFALQVVAFFLEMLHIISFQLKLANGAHVSGVFLGMLLARVKLFQRKM